jgi:thiamine kinase-like enzyme
MSRKIDMTDLSATTRYDLHTRLDALARHNKVCHGDYNPSNIILTPSGEPYIIDWAHATQGSASADAARTYLIFCLRKQDDIAENYIKLFSEKSDIAKQYIEKWLPIVAASQTVKGNPEEKEFLYRWADVVDYQ